MTLGFLGFCQEGSDVMTHQLDCIALRAAALGGSRYDC